MTTGIDLPAETLTVDVIDSHTGGEPTRVIVGGFPPLSGTTLSERGADLAARHRRLATAMVDEPRGNEAMVGALLTEPADPRCVAGVIFFDRSIVLGMCGHGMIGLVETLHRLGRIGSGEHRVETPAGVVAVTLEPDGSVSIDNVVSRLVAGGVSVDVPTVGRVDGAIAYGGNTFFLVTEPSIDLDGPRPELLRIATAVLDALHAAGHRAVDHVELSGHRRRRRPTRGTSCCARAAPTTARRAVPARAPKSPPLPRPDRSPRATRGSRSRSPVRSSGCASVGMTGLPARWCRRSRAGRRSPARPACSSTPTTFATPAIGELQPRLHSSSEVPRSDTPARSVRQTLRPERDWARPRTAQQCSRSGGGGAAHDLADVVGGEHVVEAELDARLAGLEVGVTLLVRRDVIR